MPSLDYVPPLDIMMLDYQQSYPDQTQNYPSSAPHQQIPPSPEYPDSYQRQSPLQPQAEAAEMYRHPSPVGSYHAHSVSPFNYVAATQQQTQFSPEFTSFQHPSVLGPTTSNLSSCAEISSATAAQQHSPSSWPPVSSSITGYPSSPATGGSDWNAYQSTDGFPNNPNPAAFPTFTGSATAACAMTGAIPTFEDFTTGYPTVPTQMFHGGMGQQGVIGLDRQMRCSYEWAKASNTYRVNPQTGKTRTKDKYRVVYTDHQRLELEKEFHYSRYITIRRKSELAVSLGLSERQVKIWFQNRRAKERKQNKKRTQAEQEPDQQDDLDQDEKHEETLTSPASATADKQQCHQQQHHTSDGDFIIRSACAQSIKSELVDSSMVSSVKDVGLLNVLRNGHPST